MAEDKTWCFGEDTPYSELSTVLDAYKSKFEEVHARIPAVEWLDISANFDEDSKFKEKPEAATSGPWWELEKEETVGSGDSKYPIKINPWGEMELVDPNTPLGTGPTLFDVKGFVAVKTRIPPLLVSTINALNDVEAHINARQTDSTEKPPKFDLFVSNLKKIIEHQRNQLKSNDFTYISLQTFPADADILPYRNPAYYTDETYQLEGIYTARWTELLRELKTVIDHCPEEDFFRNRYDEAVIALMSDRVVDLLRERQSKRAAGGQLLTNNDPDSLLYDPARRVEDINKILAKIRSRVEQEIEEAFATNLIYSEQCFMLSKLLQFVNYKKTKPLAFPLPYKSAANNPDSCGSSKAANASRRNQPILMQGESFSFMNKLAVEPSQQALFNDILPHELSSITPNIELYKVVSEMSAGGPIEYEIPIEFNINTPAKINGIYRPQRGTGVGLKSFKFSYDGTDPFSAKKAISANLSIFASSMTDLLRNNDSGVLGGDDEIATYRYTDLALKTGTSKKDSTLTDQERENIDKLNFRLKAVVQWSADKKLLRGIKRENIKNALYNSAITLYLTPVIHTFDFDDTGAVTFNISYQAYIEDFFTNDNFDIFADLIGVREGRRYVLDFFKDQNCDLLVGKEFKNFQNFDSAFIIQNNKKALNSIVSNLHERNLINYLNMTYDEIERWMTNPTAFEDKSLQIGDSVASADPTNVVAEAIDKSIQTQNGDEGVDFGDMRVSLVANSQENQNIPFIYLSDLLSVVMNMIEEQLMVLEQKKLFYSKYADATKNILDNFTGETKKDLDTYITKKYKEEIKKKKYSNLEAFRKMRIVLGPINFSSNTNTKMNSVACSIGDIPISLNYFIDFLSGKVIAKDLSHYPISKFIKDVINELIRNFINSEDCGGANTSQRISINSTTVIGYDQEIPRGEDAPEQVDNINFLAARSDSSNFFKKGVFMLDEIPPTELPILKISGDRDNPNASKSIDKMTNYYVFSAGRSYPSEKYIGDETKDSDAGIFHYVLGRDRGIVKNIKLQKTNTPGLKEVRFEQEGYAGLEQLREVYNASIDCYLNVQTFPGTYIYIVPEGFAPDMTLEILQDDKGNKIDLTKFGIGGYYMITKTEHEIAPGVGNTSIEATWVASKDGSYGKRDPDDPQRGAGEGSEKVKKCIVAGSRSTR